MTPSEADTVLALELEQKVKQRVEEIFVSLLTHYNVQQQIYGMVSSRLLHDKTAIMTLMNQMNHLQRETQFSGLYPSPWRT